MRILTEMTPMRDGVLLFSAIYLPEGDGPFPAVLLRNPYQTPDAIAPASNWTRYGVAEVHQQVRGTGRSEGNFLPNLQEIPDGNDTIDWIIRQLWSNGRVALSGNSYLGHQQWLIAREAHPALVAINPGVCTNDFHQGSRFIGGAFQMQGLAWSFEIVRKNRFPDVPRPDYEALNRHQPLLEADVASGLGVLPFWRDWLNHPDDDEYWADLKLVNYVQKITTPVFNHTGWYDTYSENALDSLKLLRQKAATPEARNFSRLVIGPWGHNEEMGDLDRGDDFAMAVHLTPYRERFVANLLSDPHADPLPGEPRIRYFLLGANEWHSTDDWPPAGSRETTWFLSSRGVANSRFGDGVLASDIPKGEFTDSFISDPNNPIPSIGGRGLHYAGARDQNEVETRSDILVYTSPELPEDLDAIGRVWVELYAESTAVDTDFAAKLVDLYPDGRTFNITEGLIRASYRDSRERRTPLEPNTVTRFEIDLWSVAYRFKKGHCLRLEIAGSNFPNFSRNPNTGGALADETRLRVARQTVFHSADFPSRLILTVRIN